MRQVNDENLGEYIQNAAFPQTVETRNNVWHTKGLTKREYFAAMAMQGMIANGCFIDIDKDYPFEARSKTCILIADALIEALNEPQP